MDNIITIYQNNGILISYQKLRRTINLFEHFIAIQYYGNKSFNSNCNWCFSSIIEQDIQITDLKMCIDFLDKNIKDITISPKYAKKKHIVNMLKKDLQLELNPAQGILNRLRGV